jgi:hypothetical protein
LSDYDWQSEEELYPPPFVVLPMLSINISRASQYNYGQMTFSIFLVFGDELLIFLFPGNFLVLTVHTKTIALWQLT